MDKKMLNKSAREKTNKKLGTEIRIVAILIGFLPSIINGLLKDISIKDIIYDFLINVVSVIFLWTIVWLVLFLYYRKKVANETQVEEKVSIITLRSQPDIYDDENRIERIQVVSQSQKTLVDCTAEIHNFYREERGEKIKLEPETNQISWSKKGRRKPNNTVDLEEGSSEKLDILKVSSHNVFLIGESNSDTLLKAFGSYKIDILLRAKEIPIHTFSIRFDYSSLYKDKVEIREITIPSKVAMLYTSGNPSGINFDFNKQKNWLQKLFKK